MTLLEKRLMSDENIFLSIHLVGSYIQNKELLSREERKELYLLKDIFNLNKIKKTIKNVRVKLKKILNDENEYFEAKVFFKPKKIDDEDNNVFRPIHTTSLIEQIAMIAMLQVLVYDFDTKTGKLVPSELSRLLPSNFYGNRISFDGMHLFKPWQEQYQEYTAKANDILYTCSETLEYKYEVSLDLENFFPSISPQVIFLFITKHLPLKFQKSEEKTLHIILKKLLIFKLSKLNSTEVSWYLKSNSSTNDKKSTNLKYAKGMPQGLPHTYFMANIYMLMVQQIYKTFFPGQMLFYVDDSVIFTNGTEGEINFEAFTDYVDNINKSISANECELLENGNKDNWILPQDYCYEKNDYGVKVHPAGSKSVFSLVPHAKKQSGELYLKSLSRETSNMGFDISTVFSDAEVKMILNRTNTILDAINQEIKQINKNDLIKNVYYDKLLRYKKFFSYRKTLLDYKNTGNIQELKKRVLFDINLRNCNDKLKIFYEKYTDDILAANIQFVFKRCVEASIDTRDLIKAVKQLNTQIYGGNELHSYILQSYRPYLEKKPEFWSVDPYYSLQNCIAAKFSYLRVQSEEMKRKWFDEKFRTLCLNNCRDLFVMLELKSFFEQSAYVRNSTSNIERMVINAIFSFLFEYNINDSVTLAKKSRTPIQYSEIRVLAALRNHTFSTIDFLDKFEVFTQDEYWETCDYCLLQVLDAFKTFARSPKRIDDLILIHKYCCDTWKNGSKYLHFYTLHNQEHAVALIKSSIQLLHAISYFKIKQIDYFVLFAACYLHDISMVTLPDSRKFFATNNENVNCIYTEFVDGYSDCQYDSTKSKKLLCETYHKIDDFFENDIRNHHANDSAKEIRKFHELDFIDPTMRELIAKVSNGHGYDSADIYYVKSVGRTSLVNEKFITILLRLSDLLDMSRYRISKVILNHNLQNLTPISRFHWISHLLTDGYALETVYEISKSDSSKNTGGFLSNGSITEKIKFTVDVLMCQTTQVVKEEKCKFIAKSEFIHKDDELPVILTNCDKDSVCGNKKCNFMCKWFVVKNHYLFQEMSALKEYLANVQDNFFAPEISVCIRSVSSTGIPNDIFDYLRDYVENQK